MHCIVSRTHSSSLNPDEWAFMLFSGEESSLSLCPGWFNFLLINVLFQELGIGSIVLVHSYACLNGDITCKALQ